LIVNDKESEQNLLEDKYMRYIYECISRDINREFSLLYLLIKNIFIFLK